MAQIVTITNPLTGQPAQVDQLDHTAQEIDDGIGFESTDYPGCYYRMVDGVVEWFNPPMQVGGIDADGNPINEYRTTDRYLGKPVYKMKVDFQTLPVGTTGSAVYKAIQVATGVSNVVDYRFTVINEGYGQVNTIISDTGIIQGRANYNLQSGVLYAQIAAFADLSARTSDVLISYTKSAD